MSWLLNLNLTWLTLWTWYKVASWYQHSEKINLFHLMIGINLVLMQRRMGWNNFGVLPFMKNHLSRCRDCQYYPNWIMAYIFSSIEINSKKTRALISFMTFLSFEVAFNYYKSTIRPWKNIVMCVLVLSKDTWICWTATEKVLWAVDPWPILQKVQQRLAFSYMNVLNFCQNFQNPIFGQLYGFFWGFLPYHILSFFLLHDSLTSCKISQEN